MACADALEGGDYIRALIETLLRGQLSRPHQARLNSHLITDCRSLFDHLRKEGIPRPPADRRLAIDLASIRQDLPGLSGIAWVPTDLQYADVLTKPRGPPSGGTHSQHPPTFFHWKRCIERFPRSVNREDVFYGSCSTGTAEACATSSAVQDQPKQSAALCRIS